MEKERAEIKAGITPRKDCFAYNTKTNRCGILTGWYKENATKVCHGCPFFKTARQYQAEFTKSGAYSPIQRQPEEMKEVSGGRAQRVLSENEDRLRNMLFRGASHSEIGRRFGVSGVAVGRYARRNGLTAKE